MPQKTIEYLFDDVIGNADTLGSVHHFVWDRTRAVRNDFSIQQITKPSDVAIAIECYERIARFHILSLHQFAVPEKPYDKYDWYQEREQLDRTLLSLMQYYEDSRGRVRCANEAEFRAYCVIFQIQDPTPDLEERVNNWDSQVKNSPRVRTALELYASASNIVDVQGPLKPRTTHPVGRGDWNDFFRKVESRQVSYLMACVAEIYFNLVRKQALNAIWRAFRRQGNPLDVTDFTIDYVTDLLKFDDPEQTENFCEHYGFGFKEPASGSGEAFLDLNAVQGKTFPTATQGLAGQIFSDAVVESKRAGRTFPAIIRGLSLKQAQNEGLIEEIDEMEQDTGMEEDSDSLFIPEQAPQTGTQSGISTNTPAAAKPSVFSNTPSGFGKTSEAANPFQQKPASSPFLQPFSPKPVEQKPSSNPFQQAAVQSPFQQKSTTNPSPSPNAFGQKTALSPFAPKPVASPFAQKSQPFSFGAPSSTTNQGVSQTTPSTVPTSGGSSATSIWSTGSFGSSNGGESKQNSTGTAGPASESIFAPKPAAGSSSGAAKPSSFFNFSNQAASPASQSPAPSSNDQKTAGEVQASAAGDSIFSKPAQPATSATSSIFSGLNFPSKPGNTTDVKDTTAVGQQPNPAQSSTTSLFGEKSVFAPPSEPKESTQPQGSPFPFKPPTPSATTNDEQKDTQKPVFSFPSQTPVPSPTPTQIPAPVSEPVKTVTATPVTSSTPNPTPAPRTSFSQPNQPKKPSPLSQSYTAPENSTPVWNAQSTQSSQAPQTAPQQMFSNANTVTELPKAMNPQISADQILQRLAEEVIFDVRNGFLKQFVEHYAKTEILRTYDQVHAEEMHRIADDFRREKLAMRYGKRWRDTCRRLRLIRQGIENRAKRRNARRDREVKRLKDSEQDKINAVDDFLKKGQLGLPSRNSVARQLVNSGTGPQPTFATSEEPERTRKKESGRLSSRNRPSNTRTGSTSHVDDEGRVAKPASSPSAGSQTSQRSHFLGFSLRDSKNGGHVPPPARRSTYFRMKAMGINLNGPDPTSLQAKKRAREDDDSDDEVTSPVAKKSRTPPKEPEVEFKPRTRGDSFQSRSSVLSFSPGPQLKSHIRQVSTTHHGPDDIIARARAARQPLAMSSSRYRSSTQRAEQAPSVASGETHVSESLQRARFEARLRASQQSELFGDSYGASRDVPAYRLRESRFVPRENYYKAVERARDNIAKRSRPASVLDSYSQVDFDGSPPSKIPRQSDSHTLGRPHEVGDFAQSVETNTITPSAQTICDRISFDQAANDSFPAAQPHYEPTNDLSFEGMPAEATLSFINEQAGDRASARAPSQARSNSRAVSAVGTVDLTSDAGEENDEEMQNAATYPDIESMQHGQMDPFDSHTLTGSLKQSNGFSALQPWTNESYPVVDPVFDPPTDIAEAAQSALDHQASAEVNVLDPSLLADEPMPSIFEGTEAAANTQPLLGDEAEEVESVSAEEGSSEGSDAEESDGEVQGTQQHLTNGFRGGAHDFYAVNHDSAEENSDMEGDLDEEEEDGYDEEGISQDEEEFDESDEEEESPDDMQGGAGLIKGGTGTTAEDAFELSD